MNQERKIEIEDVSEAPTPPKARVIPPREGVGDHAEHGGGGKHKRSGRHLPPPPPSAVPLPASRVRNRG